MMIHENERWLLSFYRSSEICGALFFGRLARTIPSGEVQRDMTKHFADESRHAWYWDACLDQIGVRPIRLASAYQDKYLEAAGLPANLMEILAITQVFERRVAAQYTRHLNAPGLHPEIRRTLETIMEDERWHIEWVGRALEGLHADYGAETVARTLRRYTEADRDVYRAVLAEQEARLTDLAHLKR